LRSISWSPNASTAAGDKSGRDDENVIPELDAPRYCGGDPRGDLENELVDAKTVLHTVLDVRVDVVAVQIEVLQQ
jgi:hypothetical protein